MKSAWVNGSFEAAISPHDEGFLLGHGVYETIGVFDGNLPLWKAHLRRMGQGAAALGIPFHPPSNLPTQALALLEREPADDILRVTLSAGVDGQPTWCMTTRRRQPNVAPILLHVSETLRPAANPTAAIKSTSRAFLTMMLREALSRGCDDALVLGEDERILETTNGNIFFWKGGDLQTPRLDGDLLPGVGRGALVAALESMGVTIHQSVYSLAELGESDGMFVTNAVYGPRVAQMSCIEPRPLDSVVTAAWQRAIS